MILTIQNAIPTDASDVADKIVRRSLAKREGEYASEVRGLLDAALELMRERGTEARPRVADIVAAAGLSNDAFYRHFKSKDDLVAAILEDGAERLRGYLEHQMAKESSPEGQVRQWVRGVLAQAARESASATLAVLWNASSAGGGLAAGRHFASTPLAPLLHEPFRELGSTQPELDAALVAHGVLGLLSDWLWRQAVPTRSEVERVAEFCLRAVTR
ncbi:MAG TPA: helix-turn-helix domain-containing protein [Acidimicrobiales bacterium]|jgi:AcrR family transcriptional regulator